MTMSQAIARLMGTAHRFTQYSLAGRHHAEAALANANHVTPMSFSIRTDDSNLSFRRRKKRHEKI
jgi:hypothetical protein